MWHENIVSIMIRFWLELIIGNMVFRGRVQVDSYLQILLASFRKHLKQDCLPATQHKSNIIQRHFKQLQ